MTVLQPVPALAPLAAYEALAAAAFARLRAGDPVVRGHLRQLHPAFRRADVPWLVDEGAVDTVDGFTLADVRLAVACAHSFRDWDAVVAHAAAVAADPVRRFEEAVDAVVDGDLDRLRALLVADPGLVHARSGRICCFDPPVHRATLLVYVGANGVEDLRQRTPANAVEIARTLLDAGAEVDALADLYGGQWTTMCLLVSSSHPAEAGLQVPLVELLVARGARLDPDPANLGASPLRSALVFDCVPAAEALVRLGAPVEDLPVAAGLGRLDDVERLLPTASALDRHGALALASQLGHAAVVARLLDAGEDPDRFNPPGFHPHATPLHHAALHGRAEVVEVLLARGARVDLRDPTWRSDPAGWARHAGHHALAERLTARTG